MACVPRVEQVDPEEALQELRESLKARDGKAGGSGGGGNWQFSLVQFGLLPPSLCWDLTLGPSMLCCHRVAFEGRLNTALAAISKEQPPAQPLPNPPKMSLSLESAESTETGGLGCQSAVGGSALVTVSSRL